MTALAMATSLVLIANLVVDQASRLVYDVQSVQSRHCSECVCLELLEQRRTQSLRFDHAG